MESEVLLRPPVPWQLRRALRGLHLRECLARDLVGRFADAGLVIGYGASFASREERKLLMQIAKEWGRRRSSPFAWILKRDPLATQVYWFEDLPASSGQRTWYQAFVTPSREDVSWVWSMRPRWDAGTLAILSQAVELTGSMEISLVVSGRESRESDAGLSGVLQLE